MMSKEIDRSQPFRVTYAVRGNGTEKSRGRGGQKKRLISSD